LELVERFAYATSARVVMVPPRGGMRVTELGIREEKVAYIPNAVDLSTPPGALPAGLEAILRDLHGKFVVAYTGALGVPNDLESALEGMACLQDGDGTLPQDVALLLIGGGVHLDALKKRAKDLKVANVFFHDPIEKTAVRTVLARSDAGLMQAAASDHFKYGFSANKLFDYFAAGKPVLISSVYPTIVEEAGAGVRFDPGDPAAWANAVANLTRMPPAERGAMGERGRELVRSRYSIRAITDTYERLLHEVIDSRD